MVYTACAVFLYGGISDHPLPPLTAHRSERAREGTRPRAYGLRGGLTLEAGADDVERPAAAPAAAFSHVHASAVAGEAPSGISGEGWPLHLRLPASLFTSGFRKSMPDCRARHVVTTA
nr:unnamed protein product [Digitaria exilis]